MIFFMKNLEKIINVASGKIPADVVLKNANLVNVFSSRIYKTDVALCGEYIAGIDNIYEGKESIDLEGAYLLPGFIDGHIHIESSMLTIPEFAKIVLANGTTSVIIDPHEIANVFGIEGIQYMLRSSEEIPLDVFVMLPSCVPATPFETSGATLHAGDMMHFLHNDRVIGLAEMMNFPGVLEEQPIVLDKLKMMNEALIDGHSPGLSGKNLCAYIAAGIYSDHESVSVEEARTKLEKGMYVMIREGSTARNLQALLPVVNKDTENMCIFVSDDKNPYDLSQNGHMNAIIKKAVSLGIDFITALKMCTINTARYFKLPQRGALAPGYHADIVVVDNVQDLTIKQVFKSGKCIVKDRRLIENQFPMTCTQPIRGSVNIAPLSPESFTLKAKSSRCRAIGIVPQQLITEELIVSPEIIDGYVQSSVVNDILKIAVVERHYASGNIGIGLVKGFQLKEGAIASTVAHDSHNIIVLGTNDRDMMTAVIHLRDIQGGLCFAHNGSIISDLPLPIAGLMSEQPIHHVTTALYALIQAVRNAGVMLEDPFIALSFLALPVIPTLKITDKGLFNTNSGAFVDVCI